MTDGKGGIVLFEGKMDPLVPVHSEEYIASDYFKYALPTQFCMLALI